MEGESVLSIANSNLFATPIKPAKEFISRLTTGNKSAKKLFGTPAASSEENADPNNVGNRFVEIPAESEIGIRASTEENAPQQQQEGAEGGDYEYDNYEEEDFRRQNEQDLRDQQASREMVEHLTHQNRTLQKALEVLASQHKKELLLMEEEITKHKKYAQKCKAELDAKSFELAREKYKIESECNTKVNQLKTDLEQKKNLASASASPFASFAAGRSFSMRILGSGTSQKVQAKVQANATEREVKKLKEEIAELQEDVFKLKRDNELWQDAAAQGSAEKLRLEEEVEGLQRKVSKLKEVLNKVYGKYKTQKAKEADLVFKAGWAAEQLQAITAELEYERQKHVKVSRLQVLKQTEELQRLKEENETLKKHTPLKEKDGSKPASSKKSASKSAQKREVDDEPRARAPEMAAPALLGTETIAELVALKARQREQRAIDLEKELKRNRESKKRHEAALATDPSQPVNMEAMLRNAVGTRRAAMTEEESFLSEITQSSEEEDWE